MATRLPKAFTKTNIPFSKASANDAVMANNPGYYRNDVNLVERGELIFIYESEDCQIVATDVGVTASREAGLVTITIPRETFLFSVRIYGDTTDVDGDDLMRVKVRYTYSSPDNAMLEGMEPVGLTVWDYSLIENLGNGPSESYFAAKVDKIWACTLTDTGVDNIVELEVRVEDMNYDNWKIDIGF